MGSRNSGWILLRDRLPTAAEGGGYGLVFVWHVYQGVMAAPINRLGNPFFAYWMPISTDESQWIKATERKPTAADADAQNCVLALDRFCAIRVTGWHQFTPTSKWTHWQKLPEPPEDYRLLRSQQ